MGRGQRFTEEFRVEAVRQVTERGFGVKDVSERLGVSPHSLYQWIKRYGVPTEQRLVKEDQASRRFFPAIHFRASRMPVVAISKLLCSLTPGCDLLAH